MPYIRSECQFETEPDVCKAMTGKDVSGIGLACLCLPLRLKLRLRLKRILVVMILMLTLPNLLEGVEGVREGHTALGGAG